MRNNPFNVDLEYNKATSWVEFIVPETAKPIAFYDDPFFGKYPAIVENKFGKGSFIYEGSLLSDEIQSKIILNKALEIGLIDKENQLTYPLVMKFGINDKGKTIRYYLNYSNKEQSFVCTYIKGIDLLKNEILNKGRSLKLKPLDILIVEE